MAQAPNPTEARPAPSPTEWPAVVRRLLLHARYLGASLEEAEDLAHDALEVVVREPGWFDPARGDFLGALKVVLRNRFLNRIRGALVRERAAPHLQLVSASPAPDEPLGASASRAHRRSFLALLEPEERALFGAWMRQRAGTTGPEAAASMGLTPSAYEAAKKRLRRRSRALLDELGLTPADLFDPPTSGETP